MTQINQQIQLLIKYKRLQKQNELNKLIIVEDQPFPPPRYSLKQIFSSQYAMAINTIKQNKLLQTNLNDKKQGKKQQTFQTKKNIKTEKCISYKKSNNLSKNQQNKYTLLSQSQIKYPIPLCFAYFHLYCEEKSYQKGISIFINNLQRCNLVNQYVINYNLSYLYRQLNDCKKALFYLQLALKQKPYFQSAIYDYSFLLGINSRSQQALQLLKRHIVISSNSSLIDSSYLQRIFINLAYKSIKSKNNHKNINYSNRYKHTEIQTNQNDSLISINQVSKIFHNKTITLITYYNLGLFYKKCKSLFKAANIFKQIIKKLDISFNKLYRITQKDQKLYFLSKINLADIYEKISASFQYNKQTFLATDGSQSEQYYQTNSFRQEQYSILQSLIYNEKQMSHKFSSMYHKYYKLIKAKLGDLQKKIQKFQKNNQQKQNCKNIQSQQHIKQNKIKQNKNKFKNHDNIKMNQNQNQNQKSKSVITEFNQKYIQKRMQNQKKLKFLLLKDKQLDNFFNSLPKLNITGEQNNRNKDQNEKNELNFNINQHQQTPLNGNNQANQTLIKKLRKQLQQSNLLNKFQKQYEKNKIKNQQQFQFYDLNDALLKIMNRISKIFCLKNNQSIIKQNKKQQNETQLDKQKDKSFRFHIKQINFNQLSLKQSQNQCKNKSFVSPYHKKNQISIYNIHNNKYNQKKTQRLSSTYRPNLNASFQTNGNESEKPTEKKQNQDKNNFNNSLQNKNKQSLFHDKMINTYNETFTGRISDRKVANKYILNHFSTQQSKFKNNDNSKINNLNSLQMQKSIQNQQFRIKTSQTKNRNKYSFQINKRNSNKIIYNNKSYNNENTFYNQNENISENKSKLKQNQQKQNYVKFNVQNQIKIKKQNVKQNPQNPFNKNNVQNQQTIKNKSIIKSKINISSNQPKSLANIDKDYQASNSNDIFLPKQISNIEDIFESFNPAENKIIFKSSPPTSKNISYKNVGIMNQFVSLNKLFLGNQFDENNYLDEQKSLPKQFSQQYDKAAQLQIQCKYAQAYDIYIKLYKKYKQDHLKQLVLLGIAYNFQLQEKFDQAQTTYLKCSKYNNADAFLKLGQLLIQRNRIEDGVQNLEKAYCIKRFDRQIQKKLVYAYSLKEDTVNKALSLANNILQKSPQSLDVLLMTATIFQKRGKIKQALDICLAIDNHKQSQLIKYYIGILYLSDSNVIEAFKYFKNALEINSNHVPSLIEVGSILSQLKPNEAITILNKALQLQPNNRLALTRLAKIYQSIQYDHEKAMQIYKKTLQTKLNYQAYMKIGDCLQMNNSYMQALNNYTLALNIRKTTQVYMKIASIHEKIKNYKKAVEYYQLTLNSFPQEQKDFKVYQQKKSVIISLAKNMLILLDFQGSINLLESIIVEDQNLTTQIYCMLGQGYFGKGDYDKALNYYQKANNLHQQAQKIQILQNIALCFDKKQQYQASKQIYQKILQIQPTNIKCINNLANIFLIIGQTNEAFYWYQVMLQHAPTNIQKRLKVSDIYYAVGDLSKVEYHLMFAYKQSEHNIKLLEKLINLYKQKREPKLVSKFEKKLAFLKSNR